MPFDKESEFEKSLITLLFDKGWEHGVLKNPSEQDLINNWAQILFDNNREQDRLNNQPLTDSEMRQILEQITTLRTPLKLNGFINGKTVSVKRDNPNDALHIGKEISLKIYDRQEIAAGQSRYQIAEQPKFPTQGILNDRRGDVMLLINGMPVFHIELKKSGVPVSQAANQIEKYSREGIFSGLFSLVQIFVAMNPEETLYFANPGPDGKFNHDYYFHWADVDNEPINDWKDIASRLLSIPMAHQLIGFYTIPDESDHVLKVMRSYQYYAANAISDRVSKIKWGPRRQQAGGAILGGYIWHTTGSGKTMTSFKSAQLIANSKDADKVVFLMDRIELGTQSLEEYRNFAEASDSVQATDNTHMLIAKLKSKDPADTLIVTSIQKMSRIKQDSGMNDADIKKMVSKRIVFIVDECHRSTFGEMLMTVKNTFPDAVFFGFTGTPIHAENMVKGNTTTAVFGDELHRYSIADGIRDKNVLGFDVNEVLTYKEKELRKVVALENSRAEDEADAINDPKKSAIYYKFMDSSEVKMAGSESGDGKYTKGIEDYLPRIQYDRDEHRKIVVADIKENWLTLSHAGKFHAILATSSIPEAIKYYRLLKAEMPELKLTALFDPHIDNGAAATTAEKEEGLKEIISDYNTRYTQTFEFGTHDALKKDIAARLAHKKPYELIKNMPELQIDMLIVVDQMLTGFDSKWINTLYLDKMLEYQNVIQAFSRTNRLCGPEKPFGTIRYYRKPFTMKRNINAAVKLYSGDKEIGLFVQKLPDNIAELNQIFDEMKKVFTDAGEPDFKKNPSDKSACRKFAKLFKEMNNYLEAAKIQGFKWDQKEYVFQEKLRAKKIHISVNFEETGYLTFAQRYKELVSANKEDSGVGEEEPFDIDGYLTEIDTSKIDTDYMNSRFVKYLKLIHIVPTPSPELIDQALDDLHKSFATLTQEDQKYAGIFLRDIERGDAVVEEGKSLRDYITEYQIKAKDEQIRRVVDNFGIDEGLLRVMLNLKLTEANINEYGRFDKLMSTADKAKARAYFELIQGAKPSPAKVNILLDKLLRRFLREGGFELE
jgi:type I restriction enzyme R subunit